MPDDPFASLSTSPPPKPEFSGLDASPPPEDTSVPDPVKLQLHRGQALDDPMPISQRMQEYAAEQFKKGGVGGYAAGTALGLASVASKFGEFTANTPQSVVESAIDFATLPNDITTGKVKTDEELIPRAVNAASFVIGGDILGHLGEAPLIPTKTGNLARVLPDAEGKPTARVIGPPPTDHDFQAAAQAIDPKLGLVPPAADVKPSPIKPIEGSSVSAEAPRSQLAKTGIPEVDTVVSQLRNVIDNPVVDRTRDIPNSWGGSTPLNNPTTYIDHRFPTELSVPSVSNPARMVKFDPAEPAILHENTEEAVVDILTKAGMDQPTALSVAYHGWGNPVEHAWYRAHDMDPAAVEKVLRPILDKIATEKGPNVPADLFKGTYPKGDPQLASAGDVPKPSAADAAKGAQIVKDYYEKNPVRTGADKLKEHWQTFGVHPYEVADRAQRPVVAYHGSPYDFDAFDSGRIGTGEGAQSYGHGLYFAEHPEVAENYTAAGKWGTDLAPGEKILGNKYQVKIHANKDDFLDWDKPLSEQDPKLQKALEGLIQKFGITAERGWENEPGRFVKEAQRYAGQQEVNDYLREAGVPGIKYLDQGSRITAENKAELEQLEFMRKAGPPPEKAGIAYDKIKWQQDIQARIDTLKEKQQQGTHNFVVFDHKDVEITHKNGEPVLPNDTSPMARDLSSASSPVLPLPARPSKRYIQEVDDNFHRLATAHTADQSEMLGLLEKLPSEVKTGEMQEKWYRYGEGDPEAHLTPEEGKLYNQVMIPLKKEELQLWEEAKATDLDVSEYDPNYMHRVVKGKTPQIDKLAGEGGNAAANPIYNGTGLLARSTSSMHERKYFALENESGERHVVVMNKGEMSFIHGDHGVIHRSDEPLKVGSQIQLDQNYTVRQALTSEIEASTKTRYYKNALVNTMDNVLHLRAVTRAISEIQRMRDTPEWAEYTTPTAKLNGNPGGWISPKMPLFKNDLMDPKLAHVIDDFYGKVPDDGLEAALEKINHYAVGSMFWTPVPHALNAAAWWATERGWDWVTPSGMKSVVVDGAKAIRQVVTQGPDYQRMLREGASLMYAGVNNRDFYQKLLKRAGMELPKDPEWEQIAKIIGQAPYDLVKGIYNAASNSLWAFSDIVQMQRLYELQNKGLSPRAAIDTAEKIMPNYRVPSEILRSRSVQQIYTNPNLFNFSRYHYGVMKGYANMAMGLAVGTPKQKFDTVGRIMALGVLQMLLWPAESAGLTAAYHAFGGDPNTKIKAPSAGPGKLAEPVIGAVVGSNPSAYPKFIQDYYHNDSDLMRQLANLAPLAPVTKFALETGTNRDFFTGKPIAEPSDVRHGRLGRVAGQEAEHAAGSLVEPYNTVSQAMKQGNSIPQTILEQAFGLQEQSSKKEEARAKAFHWQDKDAAKRKPQGLIEGLTK